MEKLQRLSNEFNQEEFNAIYNDFVDIMTTANSENKGPKHPASKFHEIRKKKNKDLFKNTTTSFKTNKNPRQESKRAAARRMEKYNYQMMQHLFSNQRKKCINKIFKDSDNNCPISIEELHHHFMTRWGTENSTRENYNEISVEEQENIDGEFDCRILSDEMEKAIKRVKNDSAAGPDKIYPRTMKIVKSTEVIGMIATLMIENKSVPHKMREGRTVLIYKNKGDRQNPKNWRPLTISSVIRRAIEKAIDKRLRYYLHFNNNQRGFTMIPGCHINASILNGCLMDARHYKKNLVVLLLDLEQAYDNV